MDESELADTTVKFKLEKNTLNVYQDPIHYGFWGLSLDRGPLPPEYRGRYTKKILAEEAARRYLASKQKD